MSTGEIKATLIQARGKNKNTVTLPNGTVLKWQPESVVFIYEQGGPRKLEGSEAPSQTFIDTEGRTLTYEGLSLDHAVEIVRDLDAMVGAEVAA